MNRVALLLSHCVLTYALQSAAFSTSESVSASRCRDFRPYEEEIELTFAERDAQIAGSEVALSRISLFCQERGALSKKTKFAPIQSLCIPSFNRPSRILCATCVTTISATCD